MYPSYVFYLPSLSIKWILSSYIVHLFAPHSLDTYTLNWSRTKTHSLALHTLSSDHQLPFLYLMHKNKIPYIVWRNNNFLETKFSILSIISSQQNKRNLYFFSIIPPFHVIYKNTHDIKLKIFYFLLLFFFLSFLLFHHLSILSTKQILKGNMLVPSGLGSRIY